MLEFLQRLLGVATLVFAATSMISVGFGYTLHEILRPLRLWRRVVLVLVANFVAVPIFGFLVVRVMALDQPLAIGLMLLAAGAGAPFLIKMTAAARGDLALSATILVILVPVTVIYMPFIVPLVAPDVAVSAAGIAIPLVLSMLVPLALGLAVRARAPGLAARLQPLARIASTVALLVLIACIILVNIGGILGILGRRAIAAAILFVIGAFAIGYLLAAPRRRSRTVVGLGTAQRNVAAAMVVATQGMDDPDTQLMVVITALLTLLVLYPIARWLRSGAIVETREAAAIEAEKPVRLAPAVEGGGVVSPGYGRDIGSRWGWFLALGLFLVAMGALSLSSLALVTLATVLVLGVIVAMSALAQLALALAARSWRGFSLHLLLGILGTVVGGLFITQPAAGAGLLTLLVATWLLVSGVGQIVHALAERYRHWVPSIALGGLSAVLGGLLLIEFPLSSAWLLGLAIGLHLVAQGALWIGLGITVHRRPATEVR